MISSEISYKCTNGFIDLNSSAQELELRLMNSKSPVRHIQNVLLTNQLRKDDVTPSDSEHGAQPLENTVKFKFYLTIFYPPSESSKNFCIQSLSLKSRKLLKVAVLDKFRTKPVLESTQATKLGAVFPWSELLW
jgi:hypothetical protein